MKKKELELLTSKINELNKTVKQLSAKLKQKEKKASVSVPLINSKTMLKSGLKLSKAKGVSVVEVLKNYPHSTCFSKVEYNPKSEELTLYFRGSRTKSAYVYQGVKPGFFRQFISSDSLGRFYTSKIKDIYEYTK